MLLAALDEAYDRTAAWHGANLRGALRGVDAATAAWRPAPARHNIWELTLHAAYWKDVVRRRISAVPGGRFPYSGSNFWRRPEGRPTKAAWEADRRVLDAMHHGLRRVVEALPAERLQGRSGSAAEKLRRMIAGAAFHDIYHAGQIQLLKRLRART